MGVLVIGMHRSGTSALAGALVGLGLDAGVTSSLMAPDEGNPEGYFEQWPIVEFDEEILLRFGGRWDSPPVLPANWISDDDRARAAELYSTLYSSENYVMKDPRVSLLLDLWRESAPRVPSAVFIVRDPMQVAWSLAKRDQIPVSTGLALWSAFNRAALEGMAGLRVHVCSYEDLVERPGEVLPGLAATLSAWGELPEDADVASALARINPQLRRNVAPVSEDRRLEPPEEILALASYLAGLAGRHDDFRAAAPAPGWWEAALLDERRLLVAELTREVNRLEAIVTELVGEIGALRAQSEELRGDLDATTAALEHLRNVAPVRAMRAIGRVVGR
ncbi:MAG: sulfotransferase family protein [Acidimicrobiales bacterium]